MNEAAKPDSPDESASRRQPRPSVEQYKMSLAVEVASRSNCLKSHVGAILLLGDRVRAVGWIQRLEKMKSDAYEYAKSKGVLKTG